MSKAWFEKNKVPPIPEEHSKEFNLLAQSIREHHPDYDVGDWVYRRHPMVGNAEPVEVIRFGWIGTHLMTHYRTTWGSFGQSSVDEFILARRAPKQCQAAR